MFDIQICAHLAILSPFLSLFLFNFHFIAVRPLAVDILDKPTQLVAEKRYEIRCESEGSRPNAIITWYKGKRQLRRTKVSAPVVVDDSSYTIQSNQTKEKSFDNDTARFYVKISSCSGLAQSIFHFIRNYSRIKCILLKYDSSFLGRFFFQLLARSYFFH